MSNRDPAFDYPLEIRGKIEKAREASTALDEVQRLIDEYLVLVNKLDASLWHWEADVIKTLGITDDARASLKKAMAGLKESLGAIYREGGIKVESLKADVEKAISRHGAEVVMFPPKEATAD